MTETTRVKLGDRMKSYESNHQYNLTSKVPVICRIDGRAFHTLTKGMIRPYDTRLQQCMLFGAHAVAKEISGCQIGYAQSDEISFLITDYTNATTQPFFDYKLAKMCSVSASVMTSAFLVAFINYFPERAESISKGIGLPSFDARFFNIPKEDVNNYFVWRMQDTTRNSIQMLARAHFSHKQCFEKNTSQLKEMLLGININWEKEPHWFKYGTGIIKNKYLENIVTPNDEVITVERARWESDLNIPLFWNDRSYIAQYV